MKKDKLLAYRFIDEQERDVVFYRVYTKVILGPPLSVFLENTQNMREFGNGLLSDSGKIINVLNKLQIVHGHPHESNFVVEIHEGKPRLYVIDFDQAVSPAP